MKLLQKILQQTLWQVLGKGVSVFSTFVILSLLARNYGKVGLGEFSLTLTYLNMFYLLADFGFNAHVLKKIKLRTPEAIKSDSTLQTEWNKLFGTRIIWSVVLVILAVALLPYWPFSTPVFTQGVTWASLAIVASAVFVSANLIFQSRLRYDLSAIASSVGILVGLLIFFYLVSFKYSVQFLLLGHFLGWGVIALTALFLAKRFQLVYPIFDKKYAQKLFFESWPIAATLALNTVYFRADTFMIAYFKSMADVGIYNAAYAVFQSILVLPTFMMNAYYPMMLTSINGIKFLAAVLLGLSALSSALVLILAPLIIKVLTGGGFTSSVQSLQILSAGLPAYFISSLLMWLLLSRGKYRQILLIYSLGLLINLFLNFVYIPQYSYIAASWTTVISEYLILLMQGVLIWRR